MKKGLFSAAMIESACCFDYTELSNGTVLDMVLHTSAVAGTTYQYFPSAAIEMAGYLTMTLIASFLLRLWEKKMDGPDNYVICGSQSDSRSEIVIDKENELAAMESSEGMSSLTLPYLPAEE